MATYLQGVTDFIPDYQPFQPDYNFYASALQTKQTQYDTNWKQLNNLYGQLYGAELTHDDNIKKKDELLKQIDFNLKRVSGLDLSLEQNVNQAMAVFRPFYEDKYLMKDMAYTKNWISTYGKSKALATSQDVAQRKTHWKTGIQGLELRRQMFKDSSLEGTLSIKNAEYTPFVNAITEYMDFAKKYNISKTVDIPHPSGMYIVRKKNGDVILPTLQQMFLAEYSNRPDIQDMYREKAFVERMSYAYQNAEQFGNVQEAEKKYINGKMDWLKEYSAQKNNTAQDDLETTQDLQGNLEKDVRNGDLNPQQSNYGKSLDELFAVESSIANNTQSVNDQLNDDQSTSTVQGYQDEGDMADLELARMKVDAGYASVFAEQDILKAASNYADGTSSVTYKVDQVGLAGLKHKYKLQEIEQIKNNKAFQAVIDDRVSKGYWHYTNDGTLQRHPQMNGFNLATEEPGDAGQTTGGEGEDAKNYSFQALQKESKDRLISTYGSEGVDHIMKTIQTGVDKKKSFTKAQLAKLVEQFDNNEPTARAILDSKGTKGTYADIKGAWDQIFESYTSNPKKFTQNIAGSGRIFNINKSLKSWVTSHSADAVAQMYMNDKSMIKLQQFDRMNAAMVAIENDNYNLIQEQVTTDIQDITKMAAESNPNIKYDQKRIDAAVDVLMRRYTLDAKGDQTLFDAMANEVDEEIKGILGFDIAMNVNAEREMEWYNYVFPWTNIGSGDRTDKLKRASWVRDVYDLAYEKKLSKPNSEGQLKTFFADKILSKKDASSSDKFGVATNTTVMQVSPSVYVDPGNVAARSMFDIVLGTNWNQDLTKYRITTEGNVKPVDPEADGGVSNSQALALVRALQSKMLLKNEDLDPFSIGASSIAMENNDLGSMTLYIPKSLIKSTIEGLGEDYDAIGVKTYVDNISQNGLTFIAPNDTWSPNPLYSKQFPTSAEVVLRNGPIEYQDPGNNGFYKITKTPGSGDYMGTGVYKELRPDGSIIEHNINFDLDKKSGKEIDSRELEMWKTIQMATEANFQTFRNIVNSGNEEAKIKAEKAFGTTPKKSFWSN